MIHPIRGSQTATLPSNNAQLECIRIKKVYDWVVVSSTAHTVTDIPTNCLPQILNVKNLRVVCCPLPETHKCTIISIQRDVPGLPSSAALIKIMCTFVTKISFVDGDNPDCPICCIEGPISFRVVDLVVCFPEPFDQENIVIEAIDCKASAFILDDQVEIDISICLSIEVEADVKLEVLAKFCQPRPPIPVPPTVSCPPVVNFPPQCPSFFPIANCDCQGEVVNTSTGVVTFTQGGTTITAPGTESINAVICPNCSPQGSTLSYTFDPNVIGYTFDSSFVVSFFANFADPVNAPTCTTIGLVTNLVANGTGVLTLDSQTPIPNVPFFLTLTSNLNTNTCSYNLQINTNVNGGLVPFVPTAPLINTGTVIVPCTSLKIVDCVRIPPGV